MKEIVSALNLSAPYTPINRTQLPSCFAVSELAASAVGAVGSSIATLLADIGLVSAAPAVQVDQRLSALWFSQSIKPIDWEMPPIWDAIAGDYQTNDGWIKIHTNLDHHRAAALSVLQCEPIRENVAEVISTWWADNLETEIVNAGGVAAALRSREEWEAHAQGVAVAAEPLVAWTSPRRGKIRDWQASQKRPLEGIRVLDLTRVLAGPVSTRTLAGFGAQVLRIDPPGWDEANVVPDITLGKRCANLQLNKASDRKTFEKLLATADVLIHGYRPDALNGLGYDEATRQQIAPNLIEISLDAYGWTGPWAKRRGFDSLVQMSSGIAHSGMQWAAQSYPVSLPVQALDHATGYLMAAAAIRAITMAANEEGICNARLSLARTAELLMAYPQVSETSVKSDILASDFASTIEITPWGKSNRLKPPLLIDGTPMEWRSAATSLGSDVAEWR